MSEFFDKLRKMWDSLDNPNAVPISAAISLISGFSYRFIMIKPLNAIFSSLVGGTIGGYLINMVTPDGLRPLIVMSLLLIATGRLCSSDKINMGSKDSTLISKEFCDDMIRISYTSHKLFTNSYPVLNVTEPLSVEVIMKTLNSHLTLLDHRVITSMDIIERTLRIESGLLSLLSVFIHDSYQGYVRIDSSHLNSNTIQRIISIKI